MANLRCSKLNRERLVRPTKTLGLVLEPLGDWWPRLMIVSLYIDRTPLIGRLLSSTFLWKDSQCRIKLPLFPLVVLLWRILIPLRFLFLSTSLRLNQETPSSS